MPTYVWLKQNFHKRSLPVSQKCTLMFSILFYFFLFWKCQLQPTKFISWHVYWSWLSVWKTFYYPMWPLPSSLTLSSTLLLTLLQLQLLCLRYDMVTLALGLLHSKRYSGLQNVAFQVKRVPVSFSLAHAFFTCEHKHSQPFLKGYRSIPCVLIQIR